MSTAAVTDAKIKEFSPIEVAKEKPKDAFKLIQIVSEWAITFFPQITGTMKGLISTLKAACDCFVIIEAADGVVKVKKAMDKKEVSFGSHKFRAVIYDLTWSIFKAFTWMDKVKLASIGAKILGRMTVIGSAALGVGAFEKIIICVKRMLSGEKLKNGATLSDIHKTHRTYELIKFSGLFAIGSMLFASAIFSVTIPGIFMLIGATAILAGGMGSIVLKGTHTKEFEYFESI